MWDNSIECMVSDAPNYFCSKHAESSKGLAHRGLLSSIFEIMLRLKCSGIFQVPSSRTPSILFSTLSLYFTLSCSKLGLRLPMQYELFMGIDSM